jgi:hypothetical protein
LRAGSPHRSERNRNIQAAAGVVPDHGTGHSAQSIHSGPFGAVGRVADRSSQGTDHPRPRCAHRSRTPHHRHVPPRAAGAGRRPHGVRVGGAADADRHARRPRSRSARHRPAVRRRRPSVPAHRRHRGAHRGVGALPRRAERAGPRPAAHPPGCRRRGCHGRRHGRRQGPVHRPGRGHHAVAADAGDGRRADPRAVARCRHPADRLVALGVRRAGRAGCRADAGGDLPAEGDAAGGTQADRLVRPGAADLPDARCPSRSSGWSSRSARSR